MVFGLKRQIAFPNLLRSLPFLVCMALGCKNGEASYLPDLASAAVQSPSSILNKTKSEPKKEPKKESKKESKYTDDKSPKDERKKSEAALLAQLTLGRIYENNGNLEQAEAAYTRALESSSIVTRQLALDSLKLLIERQESSGKKYFIEPLVTVLKPTGAPLLLGLALFLILWKPINYIGRRRGRNKLDIAQLSDFTRTKMGSGFGEVIAVLNERMNRYRRPLGFIRGVPGPPLIQISRPSEELAEIVESFVSGGPGKVLKWLLRKLDQPQYTLHGCLQSEAENLNLLARLQKSGRIIRLWDLTFARNQLMEQQKDLAYAVLLSVMEDLNP